MAMQNNLDRLTLLRQHLYAHGRSSIQDLAGAVGASLATIRRDLQRLEEADSFNASMAGPGSWSEPALNCVSNCVSKRTSAASA